MIDLSIDGKEVANAAADGKRAAHGIDKYIFGRTHLRNE